jgi:hypothetical protein
VEPFSYRIGVPPGGNLPCSLGPLLSSQQCRYEISKIFQDFYLIRGSPLAILLLVDFFRKSDYFHTGRIRGQPTRFSVGPAIGAQADIPDMPILFAFWHPGTCFFQLLFIRVITMISCLFPVFFARGKSPSGLYVGPKKRIELIVGGSG